MPQHGTSGGYVGGCRCDECAAWKRSRHAAWVGSFDPATAKHGRASTYSRGCRCDKCRAASRAKEATRGAATGRTNAVRAAERRLREGKSLRPPTSLPYRALATTCPECGDLITRRDLRSERFPYHPCIGARERAARRDRLTEAQRDAELEGRRQRRAQVTLAQHEAEREAARQAWALAQRETVAAASRRGYQWTGPELEIAARRDLTAREVAEMLGRTLAGVMWIRKQLRDDPRKVRVAGVVEP